MGKQLSEMTLDELLEKFNATFHWDAERKVWCLAGPARGNGNGWETDDAEAVDERDARESAQTYLVEFNS